MAAINWTMLDAKRIPVPLPDEFSILNIDHGVEATLIVPPAGAPQPKRMVAMGKIGLTDKRLVFVNEKGNEPFESLSVHLYAVISTKFEQPVFGANYYSLDLKAAPDGGLSAGTTLELRFKDRGMLDFVGSLEKAREAAVYKRRTDLLGADDLPVYSSPASSSRTALNTSAPPPDDAPPGYEA